MKTRKNIIMRQLILRGILAVGILVLFCIPQMTETVNAQNHFFMDQSHNAAAVLANQEMKAKKINTAPAQNVQEINTADYRVVSENPRERLINVQDAKLNEKGK